MVTSHKHDQPSYIVLLDATKSHSKQERKQFLLKFTFETNKVAYGRCFVSWFNVPLSSNL
jgi:hypothetical protein